jgi:hypothetical protein
VKILSVENSLKSSLIVFAQLSGVALETSGVHNCTSKLNLARGLAIENGIRQHHDAVFSMTQNESFSIGIHDP